MSSRTQATRDAIDPLLVTLGAHQTRFDGTPHVLVRMRNGASVSIGIPGIEVDRGTETFERVEAHLRNAVEYIADGYHARIWGFQNCMLPFLFASHARKERAMAFLEKHKGPFPHLLFRVVPDIGLMRTFPHPALLGESDFSKPWQRVGYPSFRLDTFEEIP